MFLLKRKLRQLMLNPPRVLALGFAGLILIGAILLNLPIASKSGESIGFINALFTSASSVCVTGLVVVNTGEYWSLFGQIVIICLIQMGGLGFMTLATLVALILGKKITLKERLIIKEQLNQETMSGLVKLTRYVIFSTLAIEGLGAFFLSTRFIPRYGFVKGLWFSIFHSISAFCNAGFDITGNSIVPFKGDIIVNLTIAFLIIIGGLGFSVYIDMSRHKRFNRLSLHSKLVLMITLILIIVGMILFYLIECNNPGTLKTLSTKERILSSFFQSVVTRTAGFNSIDMSKMKDTTTFVMIILMFIGGSPGSTAGGIKTTTFGAILLTTFTVIKGGRNVVAYKKRIPQEIIYRALAIASIGLFLVTIISMILTISEDANFLDLLFETTSAFGTVGLSRGVTPDLSNFGKVSIMITMYLGRVGPLTMAFAFAKRQKNSIKNYRYSEGNILVG
ncbi:TrkH family potassium uptake protein [Anaerosalibacter bizertensis]|uniref:TrkH family potassium uptake protein n=1 Tax=Anaerosalibacter bizertensis TaxID=932217 RepID=A0A9Q4FMM4_9FIRM|nr:TrkH family potassium uptake protein [Anaerosalibacter bizertensis]MBV1819930.1 TrkH family potassium uptake protein [Bacteroidales bacterium MSK.15.36]MCB5560350.1 TrkH family potassium uptake protein [Anaerosalibacter bizertensis]MCG4565927.1 TrkH family potassium uptake protein [Anaerosalibacter bizertensis]MCG4583255.1 TrkH family potassium uptake protein [Anaerosalibacter bizertensis]